MGIPEIFLELLQVLVCRQVGAFLFLIGCAQNAFSREPRWRWLVVGFVLMLWGVNLVPQTVAAQ